MGTSKEGLSRAAVHFLLLIFCIASKCVAASGLNSTQMVTLKVDASPKLARKIPDTFLGVFFEVMLFLAIHQLLWLIIGSIPSINNPQAVGSWLLAITSQVILQEMGHGGAGGIWAELVSNRGFEAGGPNTPSNIDPWLIIGDDSSIFVATDRSSCFSRNIVALRMEALCNDCPAAGVGIYNPGFWGMNIEDGKAYNLVMYVKSHETTCLTVSLTSSDGLQNLASVTIIVAGKSKWIKVKKKLVAKGTNRTSRLQITSKKKGVVWLDQVSLMPADTYKVYYAFVESYTETLKDKPDQIGSGHGFRNGLVSMLLDLKPRFLRFPGGCFVEGGWLRNAFRWRQSIGPWEERPGHFGDCWQYWTDDGLGYFEFLQLSEDIGAAPIWVFNNGISYNDEVNTATIAPFVKDILDSLEFARGSVNSTWGSVRAKMGHPKPFPVKYVAIGNEDCERKFYKGNYLKFYNAIREAYPDIRLISNCDGSSGPLDHPADIYDFHVYADSRTLFSMKNTFDKSPRSGPKAFVSEYAVWKTDAGRGTLLASLAEAAFLTGLEKNSDAVEMACHAPLFVNDDIEKKWNPDVIVFNTWQHYGTPSYWMQKIFRESSGAMVHPTTINSGSSTNSLAASAITWKDSEHRSFLRVKIVNFESNAARVTISITGLESSIDVLRSTATVLTSTNVMDENSFTNPNKVMPIKSQLFEAGVQMQVTLAPHSFTSFDLALAPSKFVTFADIRTITEEMSVSW